MRRETSFLALFTALVAVQGADCQTSVRGVVRNGGAPIGEAAIYLVPLDAPAPVPPEQPRTIDQVHLNFVPRVFVIAPGTEVSFLNSDGVLHNVFGPGLGGVDAFDLGTYDRNESRSWVFAQEGLHVVLCHIHPEMAAYIIVAPTRYKALTAVDGTFRIESVPEGRYRLHAWHVRHWRNEYSEEITVRAGADTDLLITLGRSTDPMSPSP